MRELLNDRNLETARNSRITSVYSSLLGDGQRAKETSQ
jgi:hypothetical protein